LFLIFTNEHTEVEFGVYEGDYLGYDLELECQLEWLFPDSQQERLKRL